MTSLVYLNANSFHISPSSKFYVPVKPADVIYSQFDHISGVASRSNQSDVPVSKIRILNVLIENLAKLRSEPKTEKNLEGISDGQADVLIKKYQSEIKVALESAKISGYGLAGATPQPGTIFSLTV